jgi:GNAT superfamily N-acetyltransferase
MEVTVLPAEVADAAELWAIQQEAFREEGERLHNMQAYPLMQTVEGIVDDFQHGPILKAVNERGEIVGSIRAHPFEDGSIFISKLFVKPEYQRQGIGGKLLRAIEDQFPNDNLRLATVYVVREVFQFYEKAGWVKGDDVLRPGDNAPGTWFFKVRKQPAPK